MRKSWRALVDGTQRLFTLAPFWRRLINLTLHMALASVSSYAAFWLRFDGPVPPEQEGFWLKYLPLLLIIRAAAFAPLRLYEGLWRYASIWDLRNIVVGVFVSSSLFFAVMHAVLGVIEYPRSIIIIDAVLLILLMGGLRLGRRVAREVTAAEGQRRLLIFGAGDAGEMIVRDIRSQASGDYKPIGFIDDDATKVGKRIHGLPVLGTRSDLGAVFASHRPDEVLVALPHAEPAVLRGVVRALEPFKVPISTLPSLRDLLGGTVRAAQIRKLEVEDLLVRGPVGLDARPLRRFIEGRAVMVTGAGGSIGSELCRQILSYRPSSLVLFERYENSLHGIAMELEDRRPATRLTFVVGDITDQARVEETLAEHRPGIIFHAAAHKHVPLMETSPGEAVKNNVRGTRIMADAAERHGVDRFILISSDKAVNPTSVMGATKRIAELLLLARASTSRTVFTAVRFGNVLASNGSVVPRFLEQIKAGGPVTITHPEIRRYFMLIPEAVQLVLHAAAQGQAGATYVLDMGEQIRILDLARDLIRLSGFAHDEIPISFVGLRPGEKLYEELVGTGERSEPSETEKILRVHPTRVADRQVLETQIGELEQFALMSNPGLLEAMKAIVPAFNPSVPQEGGVVAVAAVPSVRRGTQACPGCGSFDFHRSHGRTVAERVAKYFTSKRIFRCHQCGWRGWATALDGFDGSPADASEDALDLRSVDEAVIVTSRDRETSGPRSV